MTPAHTEAGAAAGIEPRRYRARADLLANRVILVTGAGDGLGRTVAESCAAHGAEVVLLGRTKRKLESAHDAIVAAGGKPPSIALLDLATAQGPAYFDLAGQIAARYGRLDGLVHNAAILGQMAPVEHYGVDAWANVLHVNLTAPFVLTRTLFPMLRKSGDASVVFVSSSVGRQGRAFWGAYAVSKAGIENLAQTLADETTSAGFRVNCVNPGATRTAMRRQAYPGEDPRTLPTPAQLMPSFLYLLGPDSREVSGRSFDCQPVQ